MVQTQPVQNGMQQKKPVQQNVQAQQKIVTQNSGMQQETIQQTMPTNPQNSVSQPFEEEKSKWWLWIIIVLVFLAIVAGLYLWLF